ncbi:ArsR family transcriptional regulator [Salmonella enterica]|nr:ArsR family transcriptional regulator [Salmonella enterica]EBJ4206854.1 ArsR family transcriptional regulator [Salmonella enterica]EBU8976595.1 ArsR family transcriptional regulator [Salmonella enterica subsp. enterica serovar Java]
MEIKMDLNQIAKAIGNPHRMQILTLLMEGRAFTAKELSYGVNIDPATGSLHLNHLVSSGLISCIKQGRFKYYRLASAEVAHLIETMMTIVPGNKRRLRQLPEKALCDARYCFDHLAGRLGVRIHDFLIENGYLELQEKRYSITSPGILFLKQLGIRSDLLQGRNRKFAYSCLDWSERRYHLAGALGAAIADVFFSNGWIKREKSSRKVIVTQEGEAALSTLFTTPDREHISSEAG